MDGFLFPFIQKAYFAAQEELPGEQKAETNADSVERFLSS
jgi:hypothetical protein